MQEDLGYCGLANLGNTCFLNSCLQVLQHIDQLHTITEHRIKQGVKSSDDTNLMTEWAELSRLMWSANGIVSPNKFVYNVQKIAYKKGKDIFTGWAQNDLSEFLLFLIDCFHTSLSRKVSFQIKGSSQNDTDEIAIQTYQFLQSVYEKEYSEILDLFYGVYLTTIYPNGSESKSSKKPISMKPLSINSMKPLSIKPEHFFILDLQIFHIQDGGIQKPCQSLYECFDLFVTKEEMTGDNAWYNEKTGKKQDIFKTMTFWSLPKILVIILKRFSPDGSRKLQNPIDFPLTDLDLSKYVRGYNPASYKYDLFGVCNHMGGVNGGHYTSFVKNRRNQWIHYNDTNVDRIDSSQIVSPKAYCLFYRKK
jgi:ubiquitin C-terminal hydrolase